MKVVMSICAVLALAGAANAALSLSQAGPGPKTYSNGGGGGFGGTLGGGSVTMEVVGSDLKISFTPGNSVNDYVVLYMDTRAGGFDDAAMNDNADPGRRTTSNLSANVNDAFPADLPSLPDFSAVFWTNGGGNQSVGFELASGGDGSLIYAGNYNNTGGGTHTIFFSLAQLGNPGYVNWFAAYCSETNYNSNESMPASGGLNSAGNPGFDGPSAGYENWNQYVIPSPGAMALLGLGGLAAGRRRRA